MFARPFALLFAALCSSLVAFAGGPVTWSFGPGVSADGRPQVLLKATCEDGWHIYALELPRDDGPIPTSVQVVASDQHRAGPVVEPAPETAYDPNFGMELRFHSGSTVFIVPVERLTDGAFTVSGQVEYMACNDKTCLPPAVVPFTVTVPAP